MHPALTFSVWALVTVFVVVLPGFVLAAWAFSAVHERASRPVRLCKGADLTDPAARPCWVSDGELYCPRHTPRPAAGPSTA